MAENKIWSADELLALSPAERDRLIRSSIVTDPAQIPSSITERARSKADAHIAATEGDHSTR